MTSRPTSQLNRRVRLLETAGRVFASEGMRCATTRVIARLAGVNEVTLFRHFESKLKLLAAVLNQALLAAAELDPGFTRITAPVGGWCGFLLGGGHTRYLAFKLPPELAGSIRPHPLTVKHHLHPNHRSGEQDALK